MAVKEILLLGDDRLRRVASPVENITSDNSQRLIKTIVTDMEDSLAHYGGLGLSAPQIDHAYRILLFEFHGSPYYKDETAIERTILINPEYTPLDKTQVEAWEGCLSLPNLRGKVSRFKHIEYRGYSPTGELITRQVKGMHARLFQHEYDHLDGIVFADKLVDPKEFGYSDVVMPKIEAAIASQS